MKTQKQEQSDVTSKMEHTPTPWIVKRDFDVCANGNNLIVTTIPRSMIDMATKREEAISNAAFIVKAVNLHEELVNILAELETAARRYVNGDDHSIPYIQKLCSIAKQTIAKAEGKE